MGEQGFGCACVATPEIFCMAACRHCVGWEVLQEGEEELLVLCHYNSAYVMDSWHWLWPDPAVGAARAQHILPGHE